MSLELETFRSWSLGVILSVTCVVTVSLGGDVIAEETVAGSDASSTTSAAAREGDELKGEAGRASAITRRLCDDGGRVIQVIEDDKMVRITQRPAKGITVIVLETVRDSDRVNRYTAPTVDVLKVRHPRGYEFYEKYANAEPIMSDDLADDTKQELTEEEMRQSLEARNRAQLEKMQQQMLRQQQFARQRAVQSGFQRSGAFRASGASAYRSARARASANARSSSSSSSSSGARSSGSSSGRQGSGGTQSRGGR